ncbi:MFS transporter, partial [Raoultella ornithinolytica]
LPFGITGPLAGLVMQWPGISTIYVAAGGLGAVALLLSWRLKKRPPAVSPEAATSGQ